MERISLDSPPTVDAAVVRLAKNVTLPMEDSSSFKDLMDRKIDLDLRKAYQAAGTASHLHIRCGNIRKRP